MKDKLNKLSEALIRMNLLDDSVDVIKLATETLRDEDIVTATLIGEASVDGAEGMSAVYSIIKNRASHKGISMKDVCLEPRQFSVE